MYCYIYELVFVCMRAALSAYVNVHVRIVFNCRADFNQHQVGSSSA
jgi:hypothetical protein